MGRTLQYFRQHRWQRRLATFVLAAGLGVLAAMVALPILRDRQMIDQLGQADPAGRERAIARVVNQAKTRPELIGRLEAALNTPDDVRFFAVARALVQLNRFDPALRPPQVRDRYRCLSLAQAQLSPRGLALRVLQLNHLLLTGSDDVYLRRAMSLAAGDAQVQPRLYAVLLACRLGDDQQLGRLMQDEFLDVRIAACLDAGLAGRKACADALAARLAANPCDEEYSAAALALAMLDGPRAAPFVVDGLALANRARRPALRDLLLLAVQRVGQPAQQGVLDCLRQYWPDQLDLLDTPLAHSPGLVPAPPVMALLSAARMKIPQALPIAQQAIVQARQGLLPADQVDTLGAACVALGQLGGPEQAGQLAGAISQFWSRQYAAAMLEACQAIGPLAAKLPDQPAPADSEFSSKGQILTLLENAVGLSEDFDTPVPAAAAALAAWHIAGPAAQATLVQAASASQPLAGDLIAWQLGHGQAASRDSALAAAETLTGEESYSAEARSAGFMLTAYAHAGHPESAAAVESLQDRLGSLRDPLLVGSCKCALLVLGQSQYEPDVTALVRTEGFPRQRALMALAQARRSEGFDPVLARERFDPQAIDSYLTGRLMYLAYRDLIPHLPELDLSAPPLVRQRQIQMIRDYYLLHRQEILSGGSQ